MKLWINIAASDNQWSRELGISREELARFAKGAPVDVYGVHDNRVIGHAARYEMRGDELWAECEIEDGVDLKGQHAEAAVAMLPNGKRTLMAVVLTRAPRGTIGRHFRRTS